MPESNRVDVYSSEVNALLNCISFLLDGCTPKHAVQCAMETNVGKVIAAVRMRVARDDPEETTLIEAAKSLENKWKKKQMEALFGVDDCDAPQADAETTAGRTVHI